LVGKGLFVLYRQAVFEGEKEDKEGFCCLMQHDLGCKVVVVLSCGVCSFQIFLAINVLEWLQTRISKLPGYKPGDYLGTSEWVKVSDEGWDSYQTKELNNGRLAMVSDFLIGVVPSQK